MKKTIIFIVAIIVICIAGGIGGYYIRNNPYKSFTKDSSADSSPKTLAETDSEPTYIDWSDLSWDGPEESDDYIASIIDEDILPHDEENTLYPLDTDLLVELSEPEYAIKIRNRLDIKKITKGKMFINNVLSYSGRKNDLLLSMYARFRNTLFNFISKEQFHQLGIPETISSLNNAYYHYLEEDNLNEEYIQEVYNVLCGTSDNELIIPDLLDYENENPESHSFWAITFWARRYGENNVPAVRAILDDLWAYYMLDEETELSTDSYYNEPRPMDENCDYIYIQYYPSKKLQCIYQYNIHGQRSGQWIYYNYFREHIDEECWMENDMMNGEHREYYADDYLKSRTQFLNDSILLSTHYHLTKDSTEKFVEYTWGDNQLQFSRMGNVIP